MKIFRCGPDRIRRCAEVLAAAFEDDPLWVYVIPEVSERIRILPPAFDRFLRYFFMFGEVYVAGDEIIGVAAWLPAAYWQGTPERDRACGADDLSSVMGIAATRRFGDYVAFLEQLHERALPGSHWYLPQLGVHPEHQGHGAGGALLQPILMRADAEGLPCYLETEKLRNVPFYRRHGFENVVAGVEPVSGLIYWTFRRLPRKLGTG
jgi:GNAT superfamily N-acetyltransferase